MRAPTSTRAIRATTRAPSRAGAHGITVRCCSSAAPRRGPRACSAPTRLRAAPARRRPGRCRPSRSSTCAGCTTRCIRTTRLALADCRRAGGKAIVLLNRRGWSNFLSCGSCGRVWMCPNCEVALVLHRAGCCVACHHCGHREPRARRTAPTAARSRSARHGAGTERLEHELVAALAGEGFPVLRLDADAAGTRRACAASLERFHAAAARRADRHADGRQGPRLRATSGSGS